MDLAAVDVPPVVPLLARVALEARKLLDKEDLDTLSVGDFRRKLAVHLGLAEDGLEAQKDEVTFVVAGLVKELSVSRDWMVKEDPKARAYVYLITFAGVLEGTALQADMPLKSLDGVTREALRDAVFDAVAHPVYDVSGGRPALEPLAAVKMAVFKEEPLHFHVAIRLSRRACFLPLKLALRRRSGFASHWSGTHSLFWSAVRYGVFTTERKPKVDEQPLTWSVDGQPLDLYEESQEPFSALGVRRRREVAETRAAAVAVCAPFHKKAKTADRFGKMDFTALVIERQLGTPSAVMQYVQTKGSLAMQAFVSKHQRRLKELLQEAKEWEGAGATAEGEKETDWALIQRLATASCSCSPGKDCAWRDAAVAFFARNSSSIDEGHLAQCLAKIICEGPSKTARVPLLVGPSNSAKSTIFDPIDEVFGPENVQHKPDLGSNMPLVNITKAHKRFMYLDEFQCVEYAAVPARKPTIPVTTMLKLLGGQYLEVQVSQSFHDGNLDCRWRRGVAITSKAKGLWEPRGPVTAEDIVHLQNRVEQFTAVVQVSKTELKTIVPCKVSFCKWLASASRAFAERVVPQPLAVQIADASTPGGSTVIGFSELMQAASIPAEPAQRLHGDAVALGAISVQELTLDDWSGFPSWLLLKPLHKRRLLSNASERTSPK
jgi:hypothetical protein